MIDSLLVLDLLQPCPRVRVHRMTLRQILEEVAAEYGLTISDLTGPCRERHIAWPRQKAMYRARKETMLSMPAIGHRLGGRDHTTILHGARAHERRLSEGKC